MIVLFMESQILTGFDLWDSDEEKTSGLCLDWFGLVWFDFVSMSAWWFLISVFELGNV